MFSTAPVMLAKISTGLFKQEMQCVANGTHEVFDTMHDIPVLNNAQKEGCRGLCPKL